MDTDPRPEDIDLSAPSERFGVVADHADLFELITERLGLADLDIEWRRSASPGGDPLNIAHVHAEDDLRAFVVEHDLPDPPALSGARTLDVDARRAVLHELLHVALRHVAAVARHASDPTAKAWLTQAIEEDTEALAEALERWIDR